MRVFDGLSHNMKSVLDAVNTSNMSKYPSVEEIKELYGEDIEEALKSASDWVETEFEGRYTDVVGKVVSTTYGDKCVFRCDGGKGKIVKPVTYKNADIKDHINVGGLV